MKGELFYFERHEKEASNHVMQLMHGKLGVSTTQHKLQLVQVSIVILISIEMSFIYNNPYNLIACQESH